MKYNPGDIVMFLKDIRSEPAKGRELLIPKLTPVVIEKINDHHVWVKHGTSVQWLRYSDKRMVHATQAGIVLFGDQECIKSQQ